MLSRQDSKNANVVDALILNRGEPPLSEHPIVWCGKPFTLRCVVLGEQLEFGTDTRQWVIDACSRHRVLCISEKDKPLAAPGDIWVGCCPPQGWGDCAGECGWLRTIEAEGFPDRLDQLLAS